MAEYQGRPLRAGILGCRGIPNYYGGYEQFAQYLSQGLVERGHQVWVYNSSLHPYQRSSWKGVQLIHCPDPENRLGSFGQFIYDYHCLRDARRRDFDVLLQLGYTSNAIWYPLWPQRYPNFIHMDGLEWQRSKYNGAVRWFLRKMEGWAARKGDVLVADSTAIRDHIRQAYGREAVFIPYGAPTDVQPAIKHLQPYGLSPKAYYLAIARFVPENNLEAITQGYLDSGAEEPLLIIGDPRNTFGQYLIRRYQNGQIRFPGGLFDQEVLNSLRHYARLYFHGHSVGGTNPSLLEAMACQVAICAHDNPFNRAILENDAFYFCSGDDIRRVICQGANTGKAEQWAARNKQKIKAGYEWEHIIDRFEALFYQKVKTSGALVTKANINRNI